MRLWFAPPETRPPDGDAARDPPGGDPGPDNDGSDGGWPGGIVPPLAAALGGLGAGWLLHRLNLRRRRRQNGRAKAPPAVTFDPHTGSAQGRIEGGFHAPTEIRLEPNRDPRGAQAIEAAGDLVASWEELP